MQKRYVNPDSTAGGDGTTAALSGDNRAFHSVADAQNAIKLLQDPLTEIWDIECDGSSVADGTWESPSNTSVQSATCYLNVYINPAHASYGKWSSSHYRVEIGVGQIGVRLGRYGRMKGINVKVTADSDTQSRGFLAYGDNHFDACLAVGVCSGTAGSQAWGNRTSGFSNYDLGSNIYRNCAAYGFINGTNDSLVAFSDEAGYSGNEFSNCSVYNCRHGFNFTGANLTGKNLGCAGVTGTAFGWTPGGSDGCSTSTPTFVSTTANSEDLHLQASDTVWKGQGTNLSGNFTTDVDGDTIVTWPIGMDYPVSTGQFARPVSTLAAGNWTPTGAASLHAAIGEEVASDAEYARSGNPPVADTMEVGLSSVGTPDPGGTIIVHVRARVV